MNKLTWWNLWTVRGLILHDYRRYLTFQDEGDRRELSSLVGSREPRSNLLWWNFIYLYVRNQTKSSIWFPLYQPCKIVSLILLSFFSGLIKRKVDRYLIITFCDNIRKTRVFINFIVLVYMNDKEKINSTLLG